MGNNIVTAIANGSAPYLANEVKNQIQGNSVESDIQRTIAHGLLNASLALAKGENALVQASGAITSGKINMLLNDLPISDGRITKIESTVSELKLFFTDWNENKWVVIFYEVLSIQSMSVENEDLSHVQQKENDIFKSMTLEYYTDEVGERFYSYNFYSVWSESALLKVIATNEYDIKACFT